MSGKDGELEWNMAGQRIRFISELTVAVRKSYLNALQRKNAQNVRNYFNLVQALYEELRIYIDEDDLDTNPDELEELVLEKNEQTAMNQFDKIRELDRDLQDKRKEANLDIPKKEYLDPQNAAVDGLN